jgi:N-methylhydantoinase A
VDATPARARAAHFAELGGFVTTPVFDWIGLAPGSRLRGPAIVEGPDTTVVVPPDRTATVDRWRNVVLAR